MRIIDVDEIIDRYGITTSDGRQYGIVNCSVLENCPTVDAEPVRRGEWLPPHERRPMYECSCCGWYVDRGGYLDFTYCPNCGAKMVGERKEDGDS